MKRIGVIAGAYDLIHKGVIYALEEAYENCDQLIVLLHEDPSVENGKLPPIQNIDTRRYILKAIRYVDRIIIYKTEADLVELLKDINPSIRFLGDDYKGKPITGMELNIPIRFINRDHGWSTTRLKQEIYEQMSYVEENKKLKEIFGE